jgi:hypothetical protein
MGVPVGAARLGIGASRPDAIARPLVSNSRYGENKAFKRPGSTAVCAASAFIGKEF